MQHSEQTSIIHSFYPNLWSPDGRTQFSWQLSSRGPSRELCAMGHYRSALFTVHQNTSYIICCITTRFKLLINDCVKINQMRRNSYCPILFSILCSWYTFMLSFQDGLALSAEYHRLSSCFFTRGTARRFHR